MLALLQTVPGAGGTQEVDPARRVRNLLAEGDVEAAYLVVVEATQDPLYRFLRYMLRDDEAAKDVFQETYVRVFQALGSFRGEAALTTWVLAAARNLALNRIRKQKTRAKYVVPLLDDEDAPVEGEMPVLSRSLTAAMEGLTETQREATLLFYGQDLTVAEVARVTGRPINTVKSDLWRSRQELRRRLTSGEGDKS